MTALRASAVYLAAMSAVLGGAVLSGAFRALASRSETGVFLLGLIAGMSLWAWGLFLVATATTLSNIAGLLDGGRNPEGGTK